jgi:hypothetical protein
VLAPLQHGLGVHAASSVLQGGVACDAFSGWEIMLMIECVKVVVLIPRDSSCGESPSWAKLVAVTGKAGLDPGGGGGSGGANPPFQNNFKA